MVILLDENDRRRRLLQHVPILLGVLLLAWSSALVNTASSFTIGIAMIGAGLIALISAAFAEQRWEVTYKAHRIRFENNPFRGEKLFIDDRPVAKGKIGYRSEMRATIHDGEGAGDTVVARTQAGLTGFRCQIAVEPASAATGAGALSDTQLLAEIQRRGLRG